MAVRKQFLDVKPASEQLMRAWANSKLKPVTEAELREQRVSFAFGNAQDVVGITKETVRKSSLSVKLAM